jgi:hypothetical protein
MKSTLRGRGLGIAGAVLALLAGSVHAEGPAVGGYVDTQYIYNFDKPMGGMTPFRSYDAQDNNISNTAHLAITGKLSDEVTYNVEVDAGSDADTTVVNTTAGGVANGQDVVLQEAWLHYVSASKLGLKAGKMATFHGIEVIESVANPTISRGYLFGLGEPFTHVGAMATYALEKVDFAVGVINGWDQQNDVNTGKTGVAKVGLNFGDPLALTFSAHHGPEQAANSSNNRSSLDMTGVTKLIPNVDLWFQGLIANEEGALDLDGDTVADDLGEWKGWTIQPVIKFGEKFSLGARYEYFDDNGSRTLTTDPLTGAPQSVVLRNISIAPAYKLTENVVVRAEYRMDDSNKKVFTDDKGNAEDSNSTGSVQFYVTF